MQEGLLGVVHGYETALLSLSSVQADEVLVFEGLEAASFPVEFSLAINSAALEIENALNLFRVINLHRVSHQHHVHDFQTLYLHREDTVNASEQ